MTRLTRTHATLAIAAGAIAVATTGTAAVAGGTPVTPPIDVPAVVERTSDVVEDTVTAVEQAVPAAPAVPTVPALTPPVTPPTKVDAVAAAKDARADGLCDKS